MKLLISFHSFICLCASNHSDINFHIVIIDSCAVSSSVDCWMVGHQTGHQTRIHLQNLPSVRMVGSLWHVSLLESISGIVVVAVVDLSVLAKDL